MKDDEMKIAEVVGVETYQVECPYCDQTQSTYYESGQTDTCLYCNKEFEIGEFE